MTNQYRYIVAVADGGVGRITLNRPDVHNALHIDMIREIKEALLNFNDLNNVRLIIIDSNGSHFSAGADLRWMQQGLEQTEAELESESRELAMLFNSIRNSSKVTMAVANGKVMGGANGIIAAADIAVAHHGTSFAFPEVRLGLVPATIAPYISQRTGISVAREWMLTGRTIGLSEAHSRGLVNLILDESDAEQALQQLTAGLLKNGPQAISGVKQLFLNNDMLKNPDDLVDFTAKCIAGYRISAEGQEGIRAFFEKRSPNWKYEQ